MCVKWGRFGMVFVGECDVVKTENKDNTVLLKVDIVENMVVNKNPTEWVQSTAWKDFF